MARTLQDEKLGSKNAREKLAPRGKPYYRAIEEGLHLGYRKPRGRKGKPAVGGKWVVRRYVGNQEYTVRNIGTADDFADADGIAVLNFNQAQAKARAYMVERAHVAAGKGKPWTVADAMDAYFAFLEGEGRPSEALADARNRDRAFIRPDLGSIELAALTADRLQKWLHGLAKAAPRIRTKTGVKQRHRTVDDDEGRRARRASANRIWTPLRAALNRAFRSDKIGSDAAWRKVKPFQSVGRARARYLSMAEAKRLMNACEIEFRPLLQAALLTGGRYGQLAKLKVGDFNPDAGTLTLKTRKGNGSERIYHAHLAIEAVDFFRRTSAGKKSSDLLFPRDDGSMWGKSQQTRPVDDASTRAKISPPATFNVARHTWASHAVMNGVPLIVVAKNFGHTDTRMVEQHYGHLAPSFIADAIRAGAPRFDIRAADNVETLDGARA